LPGSAPLSTDFGDTVEQRGKDSENKYKQRGKDSENKYKVRNLFVVVILLKI